MAYPKKAPKKVFWKVEQCKRRSCSLGNNKIFARTRFGSSAEPIFHILLQVSPLRVFANLRHSKYPNLVLLSSNHFVPTVPIVMECNSLILDESAGFEIVAFPFHKINNIREEKNSFGDIKVHEKLDGHLAILYWYGNEWNVASQRIFNYSFNVVKESSMRQSSSVQKT